MIHAGRICLAVLLTLALAPHCPAQAEKAPPQDKAKEADKKKAAGPPRKIEIADADNWERAVGTTFSPDGKWCGYFVRPTEGDGTIIVRQVEGDTRHTFKVGPSSGAIAFSHDNAWAAFRSGAFDKAVKAAQKTKKPVYGKVVLLKLADGKKTEFEKGSSFSFSGERVRWIAIRRSSSGRSGGEESWSGRDLILHELATGKQLNVGNVASFAFNKAGKWLVMTIDAEGKAGNGVQLFDTTSNQIKVLESDEAKYISLSWTREGDAFSMLKVLESKDHENKLHHLLAYRDLDADQVVKVVVDPQSDSAIPEDMTISPNRSPRWTKSRDALVFGIHDAKPKKKKEESDDKGGEGEDAKPSAARPGSVQEAGLVIWHWKDKRLQSRQQVQESSDKRFNYLCIHRVKDNTTLRIADEDMRSASVLEHQKFALVMDNSKYERTGNLDGRRFQDIYAMDLETGKKKLVLEKVRWFRGASPSGDRLLYFDGGHYHVHNLATGKTRNITEDAPVSFIDEENDANVVDPPIRPMGWTSDSTAVILYDNWDMWRVPVDGGDIVNLTVNGREDGIRYRSRYRLDPDEEGIDLSQPMYVSVYGEWTKKSGIGRIENGTPGVKMLVWDDASIGGLSKLEDLDFYSFMRQTHSQSPQTMVSGPMLKDPKVVASANADQKKFLWSSDARLVDYESKSGDKLQAALFLPADYVEGKSYPTVVYIYEKLSQRLHAYDAPRVGGFSKAIYTSQGYAVLMPDIVYRVNDPGLSSVECVLPALDAAIETGVVDPKRVGLHGHSWGGYQTSFLITQTDRFKAAVAGAPLTNLISMYSSIYWNSGSPNQPIFESSQGRFTGGYWTNIKAYTRNSPVYYAKRVKTPLLLLHNDKDGAVDWNQGIEYFNTLRRLDKPVVMLQYTGENHGLSKTPNRKDYSYRMLEFFNHYLKGEDAPDWWQEGVQHLDMKKHITDHRERRTKD